MLDWTETWRSCSVLCILINLIFIVCEETDFSYRLVDKSDWLDTKYNCKHKNLTVWNSSELRKSIISSGLSYFATQLLANSDRLIFYGTCICYRVDLAELRRDIIVRYLASFQEISDKSYNWYISDMSKRLFHIIKPRRIAVENFYNQI